MSPRFMVTVTRSEPSARADSAACERSSGPARSRPIVNDGHGVSALARAQAQDDGRVEPAADVTDDRHVAAQPPLDRLPHQRFQLVDERCRIVEPPLVTGVGEIKVPVFPQLEPAIPHSQIMARRNRLDAVEERPRRSGAERVEEQIDPLWGRPSPRSSRRRAVL